MSQQRNLPESMAWRVIGRLESGQTQCSVADAVGVARSVVARLWNPFQETGNVRRRPGAGRPRATTSTDDRYIQLTVRRNRTENATQLQRQLLLATGRRVSSQTVRNRLHEGGLYARRPMVCIPLTPRHRAARRRWAAELRDWEQHDWSQVLFTDESQFSLKCDTRRVLVWRDWGTRNKPTFVRERSQYRRAEWMVLGGISIGGRTDLHIIRNGTLTGRRYADEILRPHVIPYAGAIGDSFVFQDDNARPHRARLVENMLEAETIQRMEWPACSPDLNPWEHVWDMLGRRIAARPRPPATVRDMEIALLEEWNSIPQSPIDNLIASMANRFVEWAQNKIAVVPEFHRRILFSDEAHIWLNGYVNKQNCRIWSEVNPQVYVETPLHPEKLTVWCALWAGGIIGPYFFKNDEGHNVTVNGDRYRAMITNFFIPELNNHDVLELWFQLDGATCHTARATIDLLKDTFGDRLISRFGPVNWPPRSCDLTPLDYFLWGYVKSLVYADKPQTLDHLEDNIRRVIADIRPQMLEKVIESWTSRLDYIRASHGSHMPELILKM
ncbi:transposable element Tcb2 transposase [Trichonephila clavipes]|nr:transposable element Tcb2 transposase [Trichonephila clavipes]